MKQKLYALGAFFIEKLKLSENDLYPGYQPPLNSVLVLAVTWGGGGVTSFLKGIYRRAAGRGILFQASKYINGYHFHIKSISMGLFFSPKKYMNA